MNWKEFFKPTKTKAVVVVALFLLAVASVWLEFSCQVLKGGCEAGSKCIGSQLPSHCISLLITAGRTVGAGLLLPVLPVAFLKPSTLTAALAVALLLAYWYVLACALVWIAERIKQRNKSQLKEAPRKPKRAK